MDNCSVCNKPILPGEAIHGMRGDHWECVYPPGARPPDPFALSPEEDRKAAIESCDRALAKLGEIKTALKLRRRPAPAGTGKLAVKVGQMVQQAIEAHTGKKLTNLHLWVQAPVHRGPRWDLANWGGFADIVGSGLKYSFSSWHTMTECAKGIKVAPDGINSFDVYP